MQHQIEHGPSFAWLKVQLQPGEQIQQLCGWVGVGDHPREQQPAAFTRLLEPIQVGSVSSLGNLRAIAIVDICLT